MIFFIARSLVFGGGRTGWQPQHLLAEDADGDPSRRRALLSENPFARRIRVRPRLGRGLRARRRRLLSQAAGRGAVHAGDRTPPARPPRPAGRSRCAAALADALVEITTASELSSAHVTFLPEPEWRALGEHGFLQRTDQQFHWDNAGYASFDDFLGRLASRKRKTIRRERREALAPGIEVAWLTGTDLTEAAWDAFFAFYMDTGSRKWGRPYLTREFFSLVGEKMADRILLVMAKRAGRWIAGALNFIGSRRAVRPPLGRHRAPSVPAFRALLLPGHRLRDRPQARARRGRRPGRAQARPRLSAEHHLFRPLHRRSGVAPGGRRLSRARARLCGSRRRRACGAGAVPQGFGRAGVHDSGPTRQIVRWTRCASGT